MHANNSPWISQLNITRATHYLNENRETEVAIVGAGIAGMVTAYFILKYTQLKVMLIEGDKVAHGATGHNAGQMVSYFEKQLSGLVKEFGISQASSAQRDIDSAWELVDEIFSHTKIQTPFSKFTGYAGCQDLEEVLVHLENIIYAKATHTTKEPMMIAEEWEGVKEIPDKYKEHYALIPHDSVLDLLETDNRNFICAIAAHKGVMNSALFCEDLLDYIFINYADRFTLFEQSYVNEIILESDNALLNINDFHIKANKVVLCTNGFEKFKIINNAGEDIDEQFHKTIIGTIGYMAGYEEPKSKSPIAISYLAKDSPYFYLTRRNFEDENKNEISLVCVGGPESIMDDADGYKRHHPYPTEAQQEIDNFLHTTFRYSPKEEIEYKYTWHGLMGYTTNGVRRVGFEPKNKILLYNLGCNGVGILPSIYGGRRISRLLSGETLDKSIFDPQ